MAEIPVRFKRATAALDQTARARLYECSSSSGSEHSADGDSLELGALVDSFLETEYYGKVHHDQGGDDSDTDQEEDEDEKKEEEEKKKNKKKSSERCSWSGSEDDTLQGLLHGGLKGDAEIKLIWTVTEAASRKNANIAQDKRGLTWELRQVGLDAGLCKSKWQKTGRLPSGEYEYVDVVCSSGGRHIVEINLAAQFQIARPSPRYLSLLSLFPPVFVGKADDLKRVVTIMCAAAKQSLMSTDLHLPPWRRTGYMCSKWFTAYKRTTNSNGIADTPCAGVSSGRREVGFRRPLIGNAYCRDGFAGKNGFQQVRESALLSNLGTRAQRVSGL